MHARILDFKRRLVLVTCNSNLAFAVDASRPSARTPFALTVHPELVEGVLEFRGESVVTVH